MDDRVTRIHCLLDTTSNFGIKQRRHNNKEGDLKIFAKLLYDFYDHDSICILGMSAHLTFIYPLK